MQSSHDGLTYLGAQVGSTGVGEKGEIMGKEANSFLLERSAFRSTSTQQFAVRTELTRKTDLNQADRHVAAAAVWICQEC